MRKLYYSCEYCGKKAHDKFPESWLHGKSIVIGLGIFTDMRVRMFTETERKKYLTEWDLTFCSLSCFFKWTAKKFGKQLQEEESINPSSKFT